MYEILFSLGLLVAAVTFVLTPIAVLITSIAAYRSVKRDARIYVLKAVVALVAWAVLTLGVLFVLFVHVFGMAHRINPEVAPEAGSGLVMLVASSVYALANSGLIYWTSRRQDAVRV
ncbi:MAG TPA: hypothetical protein VF666_01640 [Pyrinomonadaceae bacterium]|jgi:uncharacterized membrane protein